MAACARTDPWWGFAVMVAGVAIGWVCVPPVLTPPGNVWQLGDTLALVVILTGAGAAGWYGVRHGVAALGAVGGASFRVLLPDSRDMIGIGMGTETLESYLVQYFAFVIAVAIASVLLAFCGRNVKRTFDRRRMQDKTKCAHCGYDLRGLVEQRCPECGVRFEWEPPPATGDK